MNWSLPLRWPRRCLLALCWATACCSASAEVIPSLEWRDTEGAVLSEPGLAKAYFPDATFDPAVMRKYPLQGTANAVAVASGGGKYLVLKVDGSVLAFAKPQDYTDWTLADGELVPRSPLTPPVDWKDIQAIACGTFHRLALKRDGTVSVWWDRRIEGYYNSIVPSGLRNVIAIAASGTHSMALKADGTVVSWGWDPNLLPRGYSLDVPANLHDVTAIAAGTFFSMALQRNGQVVLWGYKNLGDPYVPADVADAVAISANDSSALVQFRDGSFETWRTRQIPSDTISYPYRGTRYSVSGLQDVAFLGTTIYARTTKGDITGDLSFGYGYRWRLGPMPLYLYDDVNAIAVSPTENFLRMCIRQSAPRVEFPLTNAGQIARKAFTVSNTSASTVTISGVQFEGQHSIDFAVLESLPITINARGTRSFTLTYSPHQTGGSLSLCTITSDDPGRPVQTIRCVGASTAPTIAVAQGTGALESGPNTVIAWPTSSIAGQAPPHLRGAMSVAAGLSVSAVVRSDGSVVTWGSPGRASNGQTVADVPPGAGAIVSLAINPDQSGPLGYGRRADGSMVSWPGETISSPLLADFTAGYRHQLGLTSNGTVIGWGDNSYGQLQVPKGLHDVRSIAAGNTSSAALQDDGVIQVWPATRLPQLSLPLKVPGAIKVLETYSDFLFVLKADGSLLTTDPANTANNQKLHSVPGGINDVQDISVGMSHRFAVKRDGTVVSWGPRSGAIASPADLNGIIAVSGSWEHGIAVREGVGFGYVEAGAKQDMTISLRNNGDGDLTSIQCEIVDDAACEFAVQHAPASKLAPKESDSITVRFQPRIGGKRKATLKIYSNTPEPAESPFTVPLWGLGNSFTPKRGDGSFTASALRLDRQTGMLLQTVSYRNDTGMNLPNGVILRVGNLPANVSLLSSSMGEQPATLDVLYTNPIHTNETIVVTLVYFDPLRRTKLQPSVSILSLSEPVPQPGATAGTLVKLRSVHASSQGPLIEFDATRGAVHVVEYSDDNQATWHAAAHRLTGGSRVLWIDRGQPETQRVPKGIPQTPGGRFYRVKRL